MTSLPPTGASEAPFVAELVAPAPRSALANIGIFSILLALIGLLGLCFAGGMVVSNYSAAAPTAPAADASAVERFQYALTVEWQGVTQRYTPILAGFFAWHLVAILMLLVGGVRVMRRTHSGRQFMLYSLLFVLLFEVLRGGVYLMMMLEMLPLVDQVLVRELRQIGAQNAVMAPYLKRMAQGITMVSILVALVWPAIKILFYGWSARYLASAEAIELCQTTTTSPVNPP